MGEVAIIKGDGTPLFVPATLVAGGLALTKLYDDLWSVTHVATGARIGPPEEADCSEVDAFGRLVALLKTGVDWTQPGHVLRSDLATVNRVRRALGFFALDKLSHLRQCGTKQAKRNAAKVTAAYRAVQRPREERP